MKFHSLLTEAYRSLYEIATLLPDERALARAQAAQRPLDLSQDSGSLPDVTTN